jgi:hypothetical protein
MCEQCRLKAGLLVDPLVCAWDPTRCPRLAEAQSTRDLRLIAGTVAGVDAP